jgi:hypothetical protein
MVGKKDPFISLDIENYVTLLKSEIEKNEIFLPPLFESSDQKFMQIPHLYSIYYDSYQCILCGFYHPGIMLMGQLIEVTLKQIVFIHDNDDKERTFEKLIKYSENATGNLRAHSTKPLLPKLLNDVLCRVKNDIRNPYVHLNYTKLFENDTIGIIKFNVGESFQEINQKSARIITKVQLGEIPYIEIKPDMDKTLADVTKRQNEPYWAINWAWELYPLFELLIDEYLTVEDYRKHVELYGSNINKISTIDDNL